MPTVEFGDVRLYYDHHGTGGEPVVLVHGSWVDHHSWDRVVEPLGQALEVICYDRRGHGSSTGPTRRHPVREDASDLAALLETLDVHPVHVVAHSYGAAVALRLAHDRPEMVRSLAVHEPPFLGLLENDPVSAGDASRLFAEIERLRARVGAGDPEGAARGTVDSFSQRPGAWDRLSETTRQTFVRNAERWSEEMADPDSVRPDPSELQELLLPVLLTAGELSPPVFHRIALGLEHQLRNVVRKELPDAGHVPHLTAPALYVGLLVTFLLERNVPVT